MTDCTQSNRGSGDMILKGDDPSAAAECCRVRESRRECVLLEMPSGRETPIDRDIAHGPGGRGTYLGDGGRVCVHVTPDGELPGVDW